MDFWILSTKASSSSSRRSLFVSIPYNQENQSALRKREQAGVLVPRNKKTTDKLLGLSDNLLCDKYRHLADPVQSGVEQSELVAFVGCERVRESPSSGVHNVLGDGGHAREDGSESDAC
jgi:hypothetical protein